MTLGSIPHRNFVRVAFVNYSLPPVCSVCFERERDNRQMASWGKYMHFFCQDYNFSSLLSTTHTHFSLWLIEPLIPLHYFSESYSGFQIRFFTELRNFSKPNEWIGACEKYKTLTRCNSLYWKYNVSVLRPSSFFSPTLFLRYDFCLLAQHSQNVTRARVSECVSFCIVVQRKQASSGTRLHFRITHCLCHLSSPQIRWPITAFHSKHTAENQIWQRIFKFDSDD